MAGLTRGTPPPRRPRTPRIHRSASAVLVPDVANVDCAARGKAPAAAVNRTQCRMRSPARPVVATVLRPPGAAFYRAVARQADLLPRHRRTTSRLERHRVTASQPVPPADRATACRSTYSARCGLRERPPQCLSSVWSRTSEHGHHAANLNEPPHGSPRIWLRERGATSDQPASARLARKPELRPHPPPHLAANAAGQQAGVRLGAVGPDPVVRTASCMAAGALASSQPVDTGTSSGRSPRPTRAGVRAQA